MIQRRALELRAENQPSLAHRCWLALATASNQLALLADINRTPINLSAGNQKNLRFTNASHRDWQYHGGR